MKFSIKDFFRKCDQIRSFLLIWSHLLKKSLMENFIFCAVSEIISISFKELFSIRILVDQLIIFESFLSQTLKRSSLFIWLCLNGRTEKPGELRARGTFYSFTYSLFIRQLNKENIIIFSKTRPEQQFHTFLHGSIVISWSYLRCEVELSIFFCVRNLLRKSKQ